MSLGRSGRSKPPARDDAEDKDGEKPPNSAARSSGAAHQHADTKDAEGIYTKTANQKSILKNPSAHAQEDDGTDYDSLFALLTPTGTAVALVVSDWRARYNANPTTALAELYTLVAKAGGCATTVTALEVQRMNADDIGMGVLADMREGNLYNEDPMDSLGLRGSKGRFKGFRNNYLEFWDKLLRDSSETDELFSAGNMVKGEENKDSRKANDSSSSPLFDSLSDLVAMFSGLRARKIRVAATEAGLQLVTSLVHIAKVKADTRDLKQRQLDAEGKKKRPNVSMMKTLNEGLALTQARIRSVESMIKDSFNKIFTHRFRDIDPAIRSICMRSIGSWMREHPLFFLTDFYLKYLGWSLNDKDPGVRLTVLVALRQLYAASSENLALMDTFTARFIWRVREMVNDVDPSVAAEVVGTLAVLHAAGVLPRKDVEPVVSLLLDGDEQIRTAAAAVIPSLMTNSKEIIDIDHIAGYDVSLARINANASSVGDGYEGSSHSTLLSIVHIIKGLHGSRARTASTVDALWNIYHAQLSDWNLICTMLLSENPDTKRNHGLLTPVRLKSEDAAGLTNLLACAVRRAQGEHLVMAEYSSGHGVYGSSQRPPTKAQRDAHEHARESFTQVAMKLLPLILRRWRSDEAVSGPLIETIRHLKLEHYSLKHRETDFEELMNCVVDVFLQHHSRRVLDACVSAMHYAVTEGFDSLREIGNRCRDTVFLEVTKRLHTAVGGARAGSEKDSKSCAKQEPPLTDDDDDEGHHFQIRAGLTRLNALVSLLPPPSSDDTSFTIHDAYIDLTSIIKDAVHGVSGAGVRSISLAARASSLLLVHRMIELVDRGKLSDVEVDEHLSIRDAFLSDAVTLARQAVDMYPHSRILPKAIIAAAANLVVYYQRSHISSVSVDESPEQSAGLVTRLDLCPAESAVRTVWDTCNHLLDVPGDSSVEDHHLDDDVSGDEEVARMAYCLATYDVAVTNHRFIAAELLANRGHSGQWADRAIAALLIDLRHLGPHATGKTITTSLTSAFEEVIMGDAGNAAELEEAFAKLADHLSSMFVVGNQRDRVVVRCIIEEGLKFVVPSATPDPTKLPFLSLGVASFIPKLAATDARLLLEPLIQVAAVIHAEDELYAPFFKFVKLCEARARGAPGHSSGVGRGGNAHNTLPKKRRMADKEAGERLCHAASDAQNEASENEPSNDAEPISATAALTAMPTSDDGNDILRGGGMRVYGRRRR